MASNEEDDMSGSANIAAGQRRTSNIGGTTIVVLEKATDGRWLVKFEDNGVMTTIDERQLLEDYDLVGDPGSGQG